MTITRETVEFIIAQWGDEMQMAAQIRASEAGYSSTVDYILATHAEMRDDPDFQEFREEQERTKTLEEQQAEFIKAYFEE